MFENRGKYSWRYSATSAFFLHAATTNRYQLLRHERCATTRGFAAQQTFATDVGQLYAEFLHRASDPAGIASWTQPLENGALSFSNEALLFPASPEFSAAANTT
jgi:Domain of unknown function (DUF4214)